MKKTLLAGMGATIVTRDAIEKTLNEWVEKGKLTQKEVDEITRNLVDDAEKDYEQSLNQFEKWFEDMVEEFGLVRKKELNQLEKRVKVLESKPKKKKAAKKSKSKK